MLFQNNAQMSKPIELTKISGGKVWSDHSKLTVLLLAIPSYEDRRFNYYSLYYFGCKSEILSTGKI